MKQSFYRSFHRIYILIGVSLLKDRNTSESISKNIISFRKSENSELTLKSYQIVNNFNIICQLRSSIFIQISVISDECT